MEALKFPIETDRISKLLQFCYFWNVKWQPSLAQMHPVLVQQTEQHPQLPFGDEQIPKHVDMEALEFPKKPR